MLCQLGAAASVDAHGGIFRCCTDCATLADKNVSSAVHPFRLATPDGQALNFQWSLRRNCSLSPAQLLRFYIGLCLLSLSIATAFWFSGARMVMPFAWLELIAVGAALLVYARHACDGEKITLQGPVLVVERDHGRRSERTEFDRQWVRIEPCSGDGSLIEVSGQGRSVLVGRHLRPELRPALAREIRLALRGA